MIRCVTTPVRVTFYYLKAISTDKLQEIITNKDIANAAMIKITIDVGKKLLNREALLLPMINDIFNSHACHIYHQQQGAVARTRKSVGKDVNA